MINMTLPDDDTFVAIGNKNKMEKDTTSLLCDKCWLRGKPLPRLLTMRLPEKALCCTGEQNIHSKGVGRAGVMRMKTMPVGIIRNSPVSSDVKSEDSSELISPLSSVPCLKDETDCSNHTPCCELNLLGMDCRCSERLVKSSQLGHKIQDHPPKNDNATHKNENHQIDPVEKKKKPLKDQLQIQSEKEFPSLTQLPQSELGAKTRNAFSLISTKFLDENAGSILSGKVKQPVDTIPAVENEDKEPETLGRSISSGRSTVESEKKEAMALGRTVHFEFLPPDCNRDMLITLLSMYGTVEDCKLTRRSNQYADAEIVMDSTDGAQWVVSSMSDEDPLLSGEGVHKPRCYLK